MTPMPLESKNGKTMIEFEKIKGQPALSSIKLPRSRNHEIVKFRTARPSFNVSPDKKLTDLFHTRNTEDVQSDNISSISSSSKTNDLFDDENEATQSRN